MTQPSSPSPQAAEMDAVRSELKALKELVARLQARMEEIEVELSALRDLI